ncbi:hypothetical protein [uncultured Tateyamaria sp.]|uniref:hypothetical protein n=1 Tax=uncultured Tateyamaria sp. TaxID=455651 RepID=UPI00260B1FA5|nr:hypothetical protein [uncultured Tateyamaria sp.]
MFRSLAPTVALVLAGAAHADTAPIPMTYEIFEASVVHLDLDSCPASLPQENSFCRAAILHDAVHVFAFADSGDSPMIGYRAFDAPPLGETLQ